MNSELGTFAVTGSSGWFASALISQLAQNGHRVHCLDIQEPVTDPCNRHCCIDRSLITFHRCDITDYDQVLSALQNDIQTVFHVCAITDIRPCPSSSMHHVNVNGTATLLRACKQSRIKQFVYTSSIEVVNDGKPKNNASEELPYVESYNLYGTSKTVAEKMVLAAGDANMATAALRLAHIFGPGDPILFACTKFPVNIGDGTCLHSFIYIENCAYAHIQAAKALASSKTRPACNRQAFNIKDMDSNFIHWYRDVLCEVKPTAWVVYLPYAVALILAHLYDWIVWIIFHISGTRIGHPIESFGVLAVEAACQQHTYSADKFARVVGYEPPVDIQEAVRRTREWRKQKYKH